MKKSIVVTITAGLVLMMSSMAMAQAGLNASGALTVTATVNSTIGIVFNSDAAGLALASGAGTNTATLAFGNISAYGAIAGGVTRTVAPGVSFTVSTPVDIQVGKTNVNSANYTL